MKTFGWWDLVFSIPDDWDIARIEGNKVKGYLRIDDRLMTRLELRWDTVKRGVNIDRIIGAYLKKVERLNKHRSLKIKRHIGIEQYGNQAGYEYEYFTWEHELTVYGFCRYCKICDRILFFTVFSGTDETLESAVKKVFSSVSDHQESGMSSWGVYDFNFKVPGSFFLTNHSLKAGHLRFCFRNSERELLNIDRISMADAVLKTKLFEEWYLNFFADFLRRHDYAHKLGRQNNTHQAITAAGKAKLFPGLSLVLKSKFLHVYAWHCEPGNKIYSVSALTGEDEQDTINFARDNISCCSERKR